MPKAERWPMLSDAEEALLQAGIAHDPDNPELNDEELAAMRPAGETLAPDLYARLVRARGRPKAEVTKTPVKLRLDPDVIEMFRSQGAGWQTRMNDYLAALPLVVEMVEGYEATAEAAHALLASIRAGDGQSPVAPDQALSVASIERSITVTEEAARGVRRVLNRGAARHAAEGR